jgi:histidine kinase
MDNKSQEIKDQEIVEGAACTRLSDTELLEELRRRITRNNQTVEELTVLNTELRDVNKKLEESESLKSHFISNITNEIMNPFTSILGLSRAILSVDKEAWKKVIQMVALIHSEAFSLDFQFRNIFFAAKIEAGEQTPEVLNVDILALIDGVLDNFRYELRKKHLQVNFKNESPCKDACLAFKTDPLYVKLIVSNLLNNAINFSFENNEIDLILNITDGQMTLSVKDYGVGIAAERQKMIFDRFARGDNGINSVNRGHGLGLSVSKAILDLLEGTISVKSELGKGSLFTVRIPESELPIEGYAAESNEIFFDEESF